MTARRIAEDIEAKIRSGEWPPGFRIPFEVDLAAHYGCARATANKAMVGLVQAGLVERRRKGGSFVARPPIQTAVLEIPDIAAVVAARGESYGFELLARRQAPEPPPDAGDGFESDGDWLVLDGLHLAAGRPFALEHRLISLRAAPDARSADFTGQAPGAWLLAHIPWTQARHRITARNPDPAAALAIPASAACLQVERWTWRQVQPVTFVRQLFPGDAYVLEAAFTPGDEPPGSA